MASIKENNLELNYGWPYGESRWNSGMDENIVKLGFESRKRINGILSSPPSPPSNGDAYIVGTAPTGLFSGKFANIAIYDRSSWIFIVPKNQEVVFNTSDGCDYIYNNGWSLKLEAEVSPYIKIKDFTFSTGYTITDQKQCLLNITDNHYYQWNGTLPKVVSAGSTPATAGGVGAGLWSDKTDLMLRSELNIINSTFNSVAEMKLADLKAGSKATTKSYRWLSQADTFGAAEYVIVTAADFGSTPDGFGDHALSNGNIAKLVRVNAEVSQFGAWQNDLSKNSTAAFIAAHNATKAHASVHAAPGEYAVNIANWTRGLIGNETILKRFDNSTPAAINFGSFAPNWRYKPVFGVVFDGAGNPASPGEGATIGYPSDPSAGRWAFNHISVVNCTKGIRKYAGNIGCSFDNYHFQYNDYGFFAESRNTPVVMHTGADTWGCGHIESSSICGVYYKDGVDGYGGHKFNRGMIVEGNPGFGIVIRCTNPLLTPFSEPVMDGVWFEKNATATTVTLDDMGAIQPKNIYAVNVKGMSINHQYIFKSKFDNTKISCDSIRIDSSYTSTPDDVSLDQLSSMQITNAIASTNGRIRATVVSYKEIPALGTIAAGGMVSFAPIRSRPSAAGVGTVKNLNSINSASSINSTGTATIATTPVTPGFIGAAVHDLTIPAGNTQMLGGSAIVTSGKYFVATVNVRVKTGDSTYLGSDWTGGSGALGRILIDDANPANWRCSMSIGRGAGQTGVQARFVNTGGSSITVSVADLQIVEFDNQRDAIDYANNLLFTQK